MRVRAIRSLTHAHHWQLAALPFMQTRLIDGAAHALALREELKPRVRRLSRRPKLAVVLAGDHSASRVYVTNKTRACDDVGVDSELIELPAATSESELLERVQRLNKDEAVDGILVQLPLPAHVRAGRVLEAVDPTKDVDGFHPLNVGALAIGSPALVPCTPAGILELLRREAVDPWGQHAVVVGASNIVGKPVALLLLQKGATVTICNSKTRDLAAMTRQAEILVVAVGRPNLITGDMVRRNAIVIDVGMNRLPDGKLVGDVDFAGIQGIAARATPVPGGVGPMTVAMLVANTLLAAERRLSTTTGTDVEVGGLRS